MAATPAMNVVLEPARKFSGRLRVPPDKSITHRAVLLSALANGTSIIHNPLAAEDCLSTAACVEALGCRVEKQQENWRVTGRGLWGFSPPKRALDCGNSGTTMRLVSGIMAAQDFQTTLVGDASLSRRPMKRIAEPLRAMGANLELTEGSHAPLSISGTRALRPLRWKSAVASAQVKSCVLLAGLHVHGETNFEEPSLSRDHSERMLQAAGARLRRGAADVSVIGPAELRPMEWKVPGDISSAAFFIVGALLVDGAKLELESVNLNPTRTGLLDVLKNMGASIDIRDQRDEGGEPVGTISVRGRAALRATAIDETIAPRLIDEVPILAVAATQAEGVTRFGGIGELRVKESDRIAALAKNLRMLGANVAEEKDALIITGPTPLKGAAVESYDDHRIAMSMAIAGLVASGQTRIDGSECVSISFPSFWSMLKHLSGD
jgi:3-phosphoshikimate 1-carboxyvinyltransferase